MAENFGNNPSHQTHVLVQCPAWTKQREPITKLLRKLNKTWDDLPKLFRETGVVPKSMMQYCNPQQVEQLHSGCIDVITARYEWRMARLAAMQNDQAPPDGPPEDSPPSDIAAQAARPEANTNTKMAPTEMITTTLCRVARDARLA